MKTCVWCQRAKIEQPCLCIQKMKNGLAWKLLSALSLRQLLNKLNGLENNVNYVWENKYPCLHTNPQKLQQS